jgi:hypothetical protein
MVINGFFLILDARVLSTQLVVNSEVVDRSQMVRHSKLLFNYILGFFHLLQQCSYALRPALILTLQTQTEAKRARVRQMWQRTGSDRMKRTQSYVRACSEHGRRWGAMVRAKRFWPVLVCLVRV